MMAAVSHGASIARLYAALWRHARGFRSHLVLAWSLLILSESAHLLMPWLFAQALNALQQGIAGIAAAGYWGLLGLACVAASWVMHAPGRVLERNVALQVRSHMAQQLTERIIAAPLWWQRTHHSVETTQRVDQSTRALYEFAQSQYLYLQNAISLLGPIIALTLIAVSTGLLALVGYVLLGVLSLRFDRALLRVSATANTAERRYFATLADLLGNTLTLFALHARSAAKTLIEQRLFGIFKPIQRYFILNEVKWGSIDVLSNALLIGVVAEYVWLISRQPQAALTLGTIFMVYEYARRADGVVGAIVEHFTSLTNQRVDYAAADTIDAAPQDTLADPLRATSWNTLSLCGLSLRHRDPVDTQFALQQVTLQLRRSQRYALMGTSGSGKSTLLAVLAGLEQVDSGEIRLDESVVSAAGLHREAVLLPQEPVLFDGRLGDNLSWGRELDALQLATALHATAAAEIVAAQPAGLATPINEGGSNLSGGERQRLALARGVLTANNASLVLFDEPSSSLDPDMARRVVSGIIQALPHACIVMAIHHPPLLALFDEIILMESGRIVEIRPVNASNIAASQPR